MIYEKYNWVCPKCRRLIETIKSLEPILACVACQFKMIKPSATSRLF